MRVGEMGEDDLLEVIFPRLPKGEGILIGPGDDAAVLARPPAPVVVTTDVLVQDRHFRMDWGSGADLGWRAAMQNLADVAAMGAVPTSLLVGLVLPAQVPVAWVEQLAEGFAQACEPHRVGVVGGDLTSGPQVVVAVTAHGVMMDDGEPVLRSRAQVGDVVAVSGTLGRARAGQALLESGAKEPVALIEAYLRPSPPLDAGPLAQRAGARAMMDVSDGLVRDGLRMAQASGVQIDLDPAGLEHDVAEVRGAANAVGADPVSWVLGGGEDHALLATFPPGGLPPSFRHVGRVRPVPPGGRPEVRWDGGPLPEGVEGWDHFSG